MVIAVLEFQNQHYRIRQGLYQASGYTVYELIDPVTLGGRSTLFVAVTKENQLYSIKVFEGHDDDVLITCYGDASICSA